MMIEDLYKTTDKLNKHIENMALNKVNIEFLRKQMDKVLEDIEKLKDANREIGYKNGELLTMTESIGLLMFVNGEIKGTFTGAKWYGTLPSWKARGETI